MNSTGIGGARVFGLAVVVVVGNAGHRIEHHVLQHRAEAQRVPDLRLILLREANALGVAAAFKVKDAGGAPAMLIIANEAAGGIGRQRRLAGARQPEEQRGNAVSANVRRAVHGEDVALGKNEIHYSEDGLLHLTGIFRAADEHQLLGEVDQHENFRVGAIAFGVGPEAGRADDGELRLVGLQLFRCRANEQLPHEQVVPGIFVDHLDGELVLRIGATEQVLNEELFVLQVVEHALVKCIELFRRKWLVDWAPGDFACGDGVLDGVLVFRRTASALPGLCHQRAAGRQLGLAPPQRCLHQRCGTKVAVHLLLR